MGEKSNDTPGKINIGFRFRAGEENLEEVPDSSRSDAKAVCYKTLEWWQIVNESKGTNTEAAASSSIRKRKPGTDPEIKVSKGRVECNASASDVEPGEEAAEESSTRRKRKISSDQYEPISNSTSIASTPPPTLDTDTVLSTIVSACWRIPYLKNFLVILGWCLPLSIFTWLWPVTSPYWNGFVYGVSCLGLFQSISDLVINTFLGEDDYSASRVQIPDYTKLEPLKTIAQPYKKKVCFNLYNKPYDPETYRVGMTRFVCLEVDNSILKITKVKTKLGKRAHFNEKNFEVDSKTEALYDLSKCNVVILPQGLPRRRFFNKKFPLAVILGEGAILKEFKTGPNDETYHIIDDTNKFIPYDPLFADDVTVNEEPVLYLFARCDRDKEDWFRRLKDASNKFKSDDEVIEEQKEIDSYFDEYVFQISKIIDMPGPTKGAKSGIEGDHQWLNVVVNRVLFGVFRSPYWLDKIQEKLQKKLSALSLPYYVEEMKISELNLGKTGPKIHRVSRPILDDRGVWFDVDVTHEGLVRVTIQTKLNLRKLQTGGQEQQQPQQQEEEEDTVSVKIKSKNVFDSEAEDTAESSSDDNDMDDTSPISATAPTVSTVPQTPTKKDAKSQGILRIAEKVAQSRAFQHVASTKMVKNLIEGVSQTKIRLQVDVKQIIGTVVINLPPPPSDRIWYGFRPTPNLWITATPLLGEWNVSFTRIKRWIERKLIKEFERILLLPNMDNVIIPLHAPHDRTVNDLDSNSTSENSNDAKTALIV